MEDKTTPQYPSESLPDKDQSPTDLPPPERGAYANPPASPLRDRLHPELAEEDDRPEPSEYSISFPQGNQEAASLSPLAPEELSSWQSTDRLLDEALVERELQESELRQHVEQLLSEKSSWQRDKELLLRQLADFDNLRKRAEREQVNERKYAVSDFAKEVLAIGDSLQQALDTIGTDNPALEQYRKGLELVMQEFSTVLTKFGITKLEPLWQPFDACCHQAVLEQPHCDHPTGTVIQVVRAGYVLHDRLLREALVVVSKGSAA